MAGPPPPQAHQVSLAPDQVDQVLQKLKEIDLQVKQFADAPDSIKVSCQGNVSRWSSEGQPASNSATVTVSQGLDGELGISYGGG